MGKAKRKVNPKLLSHLNRNFHELFILAAIKAVKHSPPAWKQKLRGRKGWDPRIVTLCGVLKIGFNQTYEGIESFLKESETLKKHFLELPRHSVIHRGMEKLSVKQIRKLAKRVIILIRRKKPDIAVDSTGFRTHSSSLWYDIRMRRKNKRKDCLKLHLCIDVELGLVLEFSITP
jgi:hypothetical protein